MDMVPYLRRAEEGNVAALKVDPDAIDMFVCDEDAVTVGDLVDFGRTRGLIVRYPACDLR